MTTLRSDAARRPRAALAALALATLLASLGTSIASGALPALSSELGASFRTAQWIVLSYLLAITSSVVAAGRLADVAGRRRLLVAGLVTFTLASAASGLAPAPWVVIAARAVQGIGAAAMMALGVAFVTEVVPREASGRAMGLLGTTSAVGTALGPPLGGVLIHALGWRAIFLAPVPLGLIAAVLAHRALPADPPAPGCSIERSELARIALLAATLTAYGLAATLGRGHLGTGEVGLLAVAVFGAGGVVRGEARSTSPLLRSDALRAPARSAGLIASGVVATVLMATLVVGPFYLSRALGLDAREVGLVLSAGPAVAALCGVVAGRAVDRFGAARASSAGLIGIAAGCLALASTSPTLGIPGYVGPIVLLTASYALFQTANNTAVMRDVSARERGHVAGMLNLSRNLGLVTGTAVMGALFTFATGGADPVGAPPEVLAEAMNATFAVAAVLVTAVLAAARMRGAAIPTPALRAASPRAALPQP